jgi:hypothetical protein
MARALMFAVGGLLVGAGILAAVTGGFGMEAGATALVFDNLGYDGLDNLQMNNQGMMSIGLFLVGAVLMISANATAWKETGGY